MNKYYTVSEAANRLGVNKVTVQRWLSDGKINYIQIGTGWRRIPQSEIDRVLGVEYDHNNG